MSQCVVSTPAHEGTYFTCFWMGVHRLSGILGWAVFRAPSLVSQLVWPRSSWGFRVGGEGAAVPCWTPGPMPAFLFPPPPSWPGGTLSAGWAQGQHAQGGRPIKAMATARRRALFAHLPCLGDIKTSLWGQKKQNNKKKKLLSKYQLREWINKLYLFFSPVTWKQEKMH